MDQPQRRHSSKSLIRQDIERRPFLWRIRILSVVIYIAAVIVIWFDIPWMDYSGMRIDLTVVTTMVLVIITAYYAWQTRRTVQEMERGRQLGPMPVLACYLHWNPFESTQQTPPRNEGQQGEFNSVALENMGNAPALNVRINLAITNPGRSKWQIEKQTWHIDVVPNGGGPTRRNLDRAQLSPNWQNKVSPIVSITLSYENIYAKRFLTVAEFQIASEEITKQPYKWAKLKQEITIVDD